MSAIGELREALQQLTNEVRQLRVETARSIGVEQRGGGGRRRGGEFPRPDHVSPTEDTARVSQQLSAAGAAVIARQAGQAASAFGSVTTEGRIAAGAANIAGGAAAGAALGVGAAGVVAGGAVGAAASVTQIANQEAEFELRRRRLQAPEALQTDAQLNEFRENLERQGRGSAFERVGQFVVGGVRDLAGLEPDTSIRSLESFVEEERQNLSVQARAERRVSTELRLLGEVGINATADDAVTIFQNLEGRIRRGENNVELFKGILELAKEGKVDLRGRAD